MASPSRYSRPPVRKLPLWVALAWASFPSAHAQQAGAPAAVLREVVVSGSRSEQDPDDLPVSIDVVNRKAIEEKQIRDIRDLARELPNVSVQRAPARFTLAGQPATGRDQNAGFNLRGLDGNRILMLVDGIRQPRSYVFAANAFGRDYLDIGLVHRVEVLRGGVPALYGSDALGGLVNFITSDPSSFLTGGKGLGGTASIGYGSDDDERRVGATVAGRASDSVQWLVGGSLSRSDGLESQGTNDSPNVDRTTPNPQRDRGRALLAKLVFTPGGGQRHVLTAEHVGKHADYELLSAVAKPPLGPTSTLASNSFTEMRRNRLSWDGQWRLGSALADELRAVVAWQHSDSREYTFEDRNTAADRMRDTTFEERMLQVNLHASRLLRLRGEWTHKITYGIDHVSARIANLQTGLTPPMGETFPLKRFPDTRERSTALYLQDEIMGGPWSITPGVRFERFALDADQAGFSPPATVPAASLSGSATSPKLGVLYRINPQWSVYGHYAAGFKAPNAHQVNGFFESAVAFYKTVPNSKLKPEKSRTFEAGLRARLDALTLDVAAFAGRFKDFIEENRQVSGSGTPGDPTTFQSVNIGDVRITGVEVKGRVDWGLLGRGRLSTPFAFGHTRGKDARTGRPINSIQPARLNAGLRYDAADWSARLDLTHHAAKKRGDIDDAAAITPPATQFATPSATTLDLSAQWRIRKDLRLNVGVFNLTDRKYWLWSDVRGLSAASPVTEAYTQPGRHLRVSLAADF